MKLRNHVRLAVTVLLAAAAIALHPTHGAAQPLGVFRWQLQSFCNVVSLAVTQNGGVFTLDGFDDQCGATTRAPVTGLATPNPNGTIEFGLTIVVTPGAAPVHVAAAISLATLGGTWRDSTGATGTFVFNPGPGTPGNGTVGSPRPIPNGAIPSAFSLRSDGGFLAEGTFPVGAIPDSGEGTRTMWYPRKAAFRAGRVGANQWDDANIGDESVAFNKNTRATETFSAAFGDSTLASGVASTAMGSFTTASNHGSTAMGLSTTASGLASTAMGSRTTASGAASTAMGFQSTATSFAAFAVGDEARAEGLTSIAGGHQVLAAGNRTVALGSFVRALVAGSFIFGDASSNGGVVFAPAPNTFTVRAAGGARFYSNAALTAGVSLAAGDGAWANLSDVNMKENFRDLDANDVLAKIAGMPIREWNYKSQATEIRHVGPTAQDFHRAFGLGADALRISTIDADGIALRAIQALVHETTLLRERIAQLEQTVVARR